MSFCPQCETVSVNRTPCHETGCPNSWFDPDCVSLADDGTLDTVIMIGNRELRYSQEFACEWRDEETGEFDLAGFIRDNFDELADEAFGLVDEELDKIAEWSEEYNTSHSDAGDSYAILVSEGFWPDHWKRLEDYIRENFEVSDDEVKALSELDGNDWDYDMEPGSIFGPFSSDGCVLDSFAVGEIEEQIEISHLENATGIPAGMISHIVRNQSNHCIRMFRPDSDTCELYIATDAVWFAVVSDEIIEDRIADISGD